MDLAIWYARRHFTDDSRFDFEERKSVAFLALCKAAKNFDEAKGYSFGTYAGRVIWSDLRKESYRAGSQMKRPSIGQQRPELEPKQHPFGYAAEQECVYEEDHEQREHVAWILDQLDDQQRAVAEGIMEGKVYDQIHLPRIRGKGKTTPCRVAYVKAQMVELIRSKADDTTDACTRSCTNRSRRQS
jgi:hypothetical protein